jgi:hypothetical protein
MNLCLERERERGLLVDVLFVSGLRVGLRLGAFKVQPTPLRPCCAVLGLLRTI